MREGLQYEKEAILKKREFEFLCPWRSSACPTDSEMIWSSLSAFGPMGVKSMDSLDRSRGGVGAEAYLVLQLPRMQL